VVRVNKKGILLTLGMVFVSLTILAFANVILNNAETSENRIKEFSESERIYNLDSSISLSMSRIMKYSLNETHNITFDGSVIRLRTRFNNQTEFGHDYVKELLNVTRERMANKHNINFTALPLLDPSGAIVTIPSISPLTIIPTNSSRYFVYQNISMHIDLTLYPFNVIYFNGLDESNTRMINFTYKSDDMEPIELVYNPSEITVPNNCPTCIELVVNTFYQGAHVSTEAYNFTSTSTSPSSPPVGYVSLFYLNVSDPIWLGKNRTIAFNWLVTGALYPQDSTEGLEILLPEFTGIGNDPFSFFNTIYYGHGTDTLGLGLIGETEIEIEIYLKGEALKHSGAFVSHPSYDIIIPQLDTKAENVRVDYSGLL
jgi:hypothetical protein